MKAFVGQIYIQQGVDYPFSHKFQIWASEEITKRIIPSAAFLKKYSEDFELMFRMSAKVELNDVEIAGPTVYKKSKDIEFTIFLPHIKARLGNKNDFEKPLELFFDGVSRSLELLEIDSSNLRNATAGLVHKVVSNKTMFESD